MGMSASQTQIRAPGLTRAWIHDRWPDTLAAAVWTLLAAFRLVAVIRSPSLMQVGVLFFNLIIVVLFMRRRAARMKGSPREFLLAVVATFLPMLLSGSDPSGFMAIGLVLQNAGIAMMLISILALNRSFGLAPAHRGLVNHGPYRIVRHPLYASEMLSLAGVCIGYPSPWNVSVWLVLLVAQIRRIRSEEKLLSADPDYHDYRAKVRSRLLPGLW